MKSALDLLNQITERKITQGEKLLPYLKKNDEKLFFKVGYCASYLVITEWLSSGETRLTNANFCQKHQICSSCAVRRGAKLTQKVLPKILHVMDSKPYLKPVLITLTLKNTESLEEGFNSIKDAMRKMNAARRKGLSGSGRHKQIEWCKVEGGIRSIEVTNKGKGWHPHIHVFALINDYIDRVKLSEEFQRFGGGKIVDVRKIKPRELSDEELLEMNDAMIKEHQLIGGLLEVLKYPTKFSDLTPQQMVEFYYVSKKCRLSQTFGNLIGLKLDADLNQADDLEGLEGPTRDWIARWYSRQSRYSLRLAEDWDSVED